MQFLLKIIYCIYFCSMFSVSFGASYEHDYDIQKSGLFLLHLSSQNNVSLVLLVLDRLKESLSLTSEHYASIINYQSIRTKENPLLLAIKHKSIDLVRIFIDAGADVFILDRYGQYPIHRAAKLKDQEIIKILLLKDPSCINVQSKKQKRTVLHDAVLDGDSSLVIFLLLSGARYDIKDYAGSEPLLYAAMRGNKKITRLLLNHGASPLVQDNDGKNLLHIALEAHQHTYISWYLKQYEAKSLSMMQERLYGDTPLHTAIKLHQPLSICLLLAIQPPLNIRNNHNKTVFDLARDSGDTSLIELLESCAILFKCST